MKRGFFTSLTRVVPLPPIPLPIPRLNTSKIKAPIPLSTWRWLGGKYQDEHPEVRISVQQAARTADYAAFFLQGELIEYDEGKTLFTTPKQKKTEDYIMGRFG